MATILEQIDVQAAALAACGSRLATVAIDSPIHTRQPAVLRLSWQAHGGCDPLRTEHPEVDLAAYPGPAVYRCALPGLSVVALDTQVLEAAWVLGAWDIARTEYAPLPPGSDPCAPQWGITAALALPYVLTGQEAEAPPPGIDPAAWVQACATAGRLAWAFKPIVLGPPIRLTAWGAKDRTITAAGRRAPRQWMPWEPVTRGRDHQTVIRLGLAPHGNR